MRGVGNNRAPLLLLLILLLLLLPLLHASHALAAAAAGPAAAPELVVQSSQQYIWTLDFSADGRRVVTASNDGSVKIWDTATGLELRTLLANAPAAVSPDGKWVFAADSKSKVLQRFDADTGQVAKTFNDVRGDLNGLRLRVSSDGKVLAIASQNGERGWLVDAQSGRQIASTGNAGHDVAFSPDGTTVALIAADSIHILDAKNGTLLRKLPVAEQLRDLAFRPDGRSIVGAGWDGIVIYDATSGAKLLSIGDGFGPIDVNHDGSLIGGLTRTGTNEIGVWDAQTGRRVASGQGHTWMINDLRFSPTADVIATASHDHTSRLWDARSGALLHSLAGTIEEVRALRFSRDGHYLVSLGTPVIWDLRTGRPTALTEPGAFACAIGGKTLTTVHPSKERLLLVDWDLESGKELARREIAGEPSFAISDDGTAIAVAREGATEIQIFTMQDLTKPLRTLKAPKGFAGGSDMSFDGRRLALKIDENVTAVMDATSGQLILRATGLDARSIAFDAGGKLMGLGGTYYMRRLQVWDLEQRKLLTTIPGDTGFKESVAFSPDAKLFAAGEQFGPVHIWETKSGKRLATLKAHKGDVYGLAFSPDGRFLASTAADGLIVLWDVARQSRVLTMTRHAGAAWAAFTPDGRFDGTRAALQQLHYVQDNQPIPLEAMFEAFFTPNLIAQVIAGKTAAAKSALPDVTRAIRLPPTVAITAPRPSETVASERVQVIVEAADQGGGISEIRLYQNDKLVSGAERGVVRLARAGSKETRTFDLVLVPGVNTFRAVALNDERTESQPAELRVELLAAAPSARLFLVIVGINAYKNGTYNLTYATPDAQALRSAIAKRAAGIFTEVVPIELFDAAATREGIERAFAQVASQAQPGDGFIFYYAGHGVLNDGADGGALEYYLVPTDVTKMFGAPELLAERAISSQRLKELCAQVKAQKQLILLDACQSGGALDAFAMRGAAEEKAILQLARSAGVVVLAATGTEQNAAELGRLGHGVFTYALLQALDGAADGTPKDGKITVKELEAYLNEAVPELTRQYRGVAQYPNSFTRGQDFPVGVLRE